MLALTVNTESLSEYHQVERNTARAAAVDNSKVKCDVAEIHFYSGNTSNETVSQNPPRH